MKSRSSSGLQTSPQIVRTLRVGTEDSTATVSPTRLRKSSSRTELPPPVMQSYREDSPRPGLLGPIPQGVRRISGGDSTPMAFRHPSSNHASSPSGTPENDSPWSSAVGHATTGGKSGRVIERLMAENDKLKRELELHLLRAQELEKTMATFRPQMDALRQENDNLSHARSVDSSLIGRRDRKIEELKTEVAAKTERMAKAEALVKLQQQQIEELRESHAREQQSMSDQTKHATLHAEILETSHRQLAAEYRARREAWEHDIGQIAEEREHDRVRMARLDVVYEQMRQENERTRKVQAELLAHWQEMELQMQKTLDDGEQANQQVRKKSTEMDQVVNDMRWLMGMEKSGRKDSKELA